MPPQRVYNPYAQNPFPQQQPQQKTFKIPTWVFYGTLGLILLLAIYFIFY